MNLTSSQGTVFPDSKKHYPILDGLRGVAAVLVVAFHIFEVFSGGDHSKQIINHGYLAVDFFFLLSGYVIAHAYDDRWNAMTLADFAKRRLIRLHPLIILGMLLGAIAFYFSASPMFPPIETTPAWKLILVTALGLLLLPVTSALDIRGWGEMYPLNGPAWSLFYEYIANIAYALFLRKISNAVLWVLVFASAGVLIHFTVTNGQGDVIGGWSLDPSQLRTGFTRLAFPFLAGLLLGRLVKPGNIKGAFLISSALLTLALAVPRVGDHDAVWINGLYDALVIIVLFPVIVFVGASGNVKNGPAKRICNFLGEISYPIYMTHFPIAYIFYGWVSRNNLSLEEAWPVGCGAFALMMVVALASLKLYDIPVRKWLAHRVLKTSGGNRQK